MESKNWKKIPDRMQNTYNLMRKFSHQRIYEISPLKLIRKKLPPINATYSEGLSQSVLIDYNSLTKPENPPESASDQLIKDEIEFLIKTSLKQYPKLENYIEKLKKEINQDLILYEQSLDKITKAVKYINSNKNSEKEYTNLYTEYIKPPKSFNIPKHANLFPNFSVPKPLRKRYLSYN